MEEHYYTYLDYFYIEVEMTESEVTLVPVSGEFLPECNADIVYSEHFTNQFSKFSDEEMINNTKALTDNADVTTREDCYPYLFWLAALNIREEENI